MIEFFKSHYLLIKSLHLIAVISWMAGLLYLPRLFVYHAQSLVGSPQSETFKIMEVRLARIIMTPAMIASFVLGGMLMVITNAGAHFNTWFHMKLLLVLGLAGLHGYFMMLMKNFAADKNQKSPMFFRVLNEIPFILMIFIIFLVVMKPF